MTVSCLGLGGDGALQGLFPWRKEVDAGEGGGDRGAPVPTALSEPPFLPGLDPLLCAADVRTADTVTGMQSCEK